MAVHRAKLNNHPELPELRHRRMPQALTTRMQSGSMRYRGRDSRSNMKDASHDATAWEKANSTSAPFRATRSTDTFLRDVFVGERVRSRALITSMKERQPILRRVWRSHIGQNRGRESTLIRVPAKLLPGFRCAPGSWLCVMALMAVAPVNDHLRYWRST